MWLTYLVTVVVNGPFRLNFLTHFCYGLESLYEEKDPCLANAMLLAICVDEMSKVHQLCNLTKISD
jgi:hypothetical protein